MDQWVARYFVEIKIRDEGLQHRIMSAAEDLANAVGITPTKSPSEEELVRIIFSGEDAIALLENKLEDAYKTYIESEIEELERVKADRSKRLADINKKLEQLRNEIS